MDKKDIKLTDFLKKMKELAASDLHVTANSQPVYRIDGKLRSLVQDEVLDAPRVKKVLQEILDEDQLIKFTSRKEIDFSYHIERIGRFRVNYYFEKDNWAGAFRAVPQHPFTIEELKLPEILKSMALKPRGLILVTGPAGSGKSTTLAAMLEHINMNKFAHIVTIEDPIEFLHKNKKSVICQREIGRDTASFTNALMHVLRQDPDVIFIGEMRDLDSASIALQAAETGHLVLATLHTPSASATVERVINMFPSGQQSQVRTLLAVNLEAVLAQSLMSRAKGGGRVLAMEIMINTVAIKSAIRDGKVHQIPNMIQAGSEYGMRTLDMALRDLYKGGEVTFEEAVAKADDEDEFKRLIGKIV